MQGRLFFKIIVLFGLFLALQIPLQWTRGIVSDRAAYRAEAVAEIARDQSGPQALLGPVLVAPYELIWTVTEQRLDGQTIEREQRRAGSATLLPRALDVDIAMQVETRRRGIFPVPVFNQEVVLTGDFEWAADYGVETPENGRIEWSRPFVAFSASSQRGIERVELLEWGADSVAFTPGSGLSGFVNGQGIRALVPVVAGGGVQSFAARFTLTGTQQFQLIPVGDQTRVDMRSEWPHPQFVGAQLPDSREIAADGFSAEWATSFLATNLASLWQLCFSDDKCDAVQAEAFGVSLINPVDLYVLSERAVKYGFLFIGITFAAFFLFEIRAGLAVHPVQYGLVGLALALFFLLLTSIAEHLGFAAAYLIAALSCIGLIGMYTSAVLKARTRATGLCALLGVLYTALFVILQLEDSALLIGACLLFVLLGAVMLLTRDYDWYSWRLPESLEFPRPKV